MNKSYKDPCHYGTLCIEIQERSGDGEKWRDSGYILQIDTARFLGIKKKETKDDTKVFLPGKLELF